MHTLKKSFTYFSAKVGWDKYIPTVPYVPPGLINVTTMALAETFWGKTMGKKGIDKQPPPPGEEKLLKKPLPSVI